MIFKLNLSCLIAWLMVTTVSAQIGVNTDNPLGILHIDGNGDNESVPTSPQLLNDVVIKLNTSNTIQMGIGGTPAENTQLDLFANNKGALFNRVALDSTGDTTTVPNPQRGMIVFNTSNQKDVVMDFYYFDGDKWCILRSTKLSGTTHLNLAVTATTTPITPTNVTNGLSGGVKLQFNADGKIKIQESGAYVFNFRLYGSASNEKIDPSIFYAFMVRTNHQTNVKTVLDSMAMSIVMSGDKGSHSALLAGTLDEEDEVEFYFAHLSTNVTGINMLGLAQGAVNANRCSMFYWKL